ncbi:MAG TPA: hypothetical protein ENJ34_02525 [Epsilonproteobacteria bacterium]|nr:hypothetical protein [Campylobacterota bacterium]
MKLNKFVWTGITMILAGLENIFRITPYRTGGKNACRLGDDCLYIGSLIIIIGVIILLIQYRNQKDIS